jgi:hypothetical protein
MNGISNNLQYTHGNVARYHPSTRVNPPNTGMNPLWIFLAFIIVGAMLYFMYMYMIESKADSVAARKQQEIREYAILARQAGTLPQ